MRVLANRESLLLASDGVRVPDGENFASTGMAKDVQAIAASVMEFFDLWRLRSQLANGGVGQHGAQL